MKKNSLLIILCAFLLLIAINVNAESNKTLLNIDFPTNNSVVKQELKISGWVMSTEEIKDVVVYLDNRKNENVVREARPDVLKVVKGYGNNNLLPGFNVQQDLKNIYDGTHKIKVEVINEKNTIIATETRTIKLIKAKGIINVEDCDSNIYGTNMLVGGWYLSDINSAKLKIELDGKELENIVNYSRKDVLKAIKEYGNNTENPGFRTNIDLSSIQDGYHNLEFSIVNKDTEEKIATIKKQFKLKKNTNILNIDSPINNGKYNSKMNIEGWIMTSNSDEELKLFLDEKQIDVQRKERPDVLKIIKGYDRTLNSIPGFFTKLNTSNLDEGAHSLKFQIYNSKSKEITNEKVIRFVVDGYKSKMFVENPSSNNISGSRIAVNGWFMSNNKNQVIKLYLNDKEIADFNRNNRPDVLKAIKDYGDSNTTPMPGFNYEFDASNYKDGTYTLKIVAFDSVTGKTLLTEKKSISLKKHKTCLNVETKDNLNVTTKLKIDGWAMSTLENALVRITIDNNQYDDVTRIKRPDVLKVIKGYGDISSNSNPGFSKMIDLTNYKDGKHIVVIDVIDQNTNEVLATKKQSIIIKKYVGKINIDSPVLNQNVNSTNVTVSGWIMSNALNTYANIYIDNELVKTDDEISRNLRNDVLKAIKNYGDSRTNPNPGYETTIDILNIKNKNDGNRLIKVVLYDKNTDEVIASTTTRFNLKKYKGTIIIESPTMSTFKSGFLLSGWEMSESDNSYIELYIDNKLVTNIFDRVSRGDVISNITNYGTVDNNIKPGFSANIDLSNVENGNHQMKVKLVSKYGDVLATYSKKIFIYKQIYTGIDLSYWNSSKNGNQKTGGIDFGAVKNDGIHFAMVRLGYRGYVSGKMVVDDNFTDFAGGVVDNGIKLGVYFFSQATNANEGLEEANFVLNTLKNTYYVNGNGSKISYSDKISYPIAFDTERVEGAIGRADYISKQARTDAAKAFCKRIKEAGYTPIIYASKSFLYNDLYMNQLQDYDVWVAHYNNSGNYIDNPTDYTGAYQMWQYTSTGRVSGITGNGGKVDLSISYYNY